MWVSSLYVLEGHLVYVYKRHVMYVNMLKIQYYRQYYMGIDSIIDSTRDSKYKRQWISIRDSIIDSI
jgi:hypothetical protein